MQGKYSQRSTIRKQRKAKQRAEKKQQAGSKESKANSTASSCLMFFFESKEQRTPKKQSNTKRMNKQTQSQMCKSKRPSLVPDPAYQKEHTPAVVYYFHFHPPCSHNRANWAFESREPPFIFADDQRRPETRVEHSRTEQRRSAVRTVAGQYRRRPEQRETAKQEDNMQQRQSKRNSAE